MDSAVHFVKISSSRKHGRVLWILIALVPSVDMMRLDVKRSGFLGHQIDGSLIITLDPLEVSISVHENWIQELPTLGITVTL